MDETLSAREALHSRFTTHDGIELFYRHWASTSPKPRGAVVFIHRGHEHSGRMAHLVDELNLPEFSFFGWDARGHGHSPGERGDSPSIGTSVRDIQTFMQHIGTTHGVEEENVVIIAQSVGAVLASAWAHDYAPKVRALVLASPAFKVKLYVPLARPALRLARMLRGNFYVQSYVKGKYLTHDPARIASFASDELITRAISVNILLGLYEVADRVVADAAAITIPTQLLISGSDWVVHHGPQHKFFNRLGALVKERHVLPGFYHDTLGEKDRAVAVQLIRDFILARFEEPICRPSLQDADKLGVTRKEADKLATPLPSLSPQGAYWAATRALLQLGGWFSESIELGHQTGFDSGSTLDYVYRNQPTSKTVLGRCMDRVYLDSIGWRGIRQRKLNAEELIRYAISRLHEAGEPVRVMDIAAGHGRYVLEALDKAELKPESILLRDYSDLNVTEGNALIVEKGLQDITRFIKGNAFDRADLGATEPVPTLGIVSGLYELFADNDLVRDSLAGLAEAIPSGGYLVYTGQPWHPQLEFIARALTSHRQGEAWVMRRRTQAELDELVAAAGFHKLDQRIDEWGIFTVSLAQRAHA